MQRRAKGIAATLAVALLATGAVVMVTGGGERSVMAGEPVAQEAAQGTPVLANDALFMSSVTGSETIPVTGQPFDRAVRVTLATKGADTNAVQLLAPTNAPVAVGDGLVASLSVRGRAKDGGPARVIVLFEKSSNPWTKSVTQTVTGPKNSDEWKRVVIPFTAAEAYAPGAAMLSIRLATQAQTVEIADLRVLNYGKPTNQDAFLDSAYRQASFGRVTVAVDLSKTRQTMEGFGGNFAKGRFGMTEPNDAVGRYVLDNLKVRHARIGIPLQYWQDGPGQPYKDEGPVRGTFQLMQEMKRRGIPMVASAWDAPKWMISNPERDNGRIIPRERWDDCINALTAWLTTARDRYGVTVDYVSFNEADGGYQIKFTSAEIADFIKRAMPKFQSAGLKVKWLAGDTANGGGLVRYTRPLLEDKELAPHLGPISFHSWDALTADPSTYKAIADLGREFKKPVWCLEMGHDPQLWRVQPPVWDTWDNGLRLGTAYIRTIRYAEASLLSYWEYQADYPLVDGDQGRPYPAFKVIQQLENALIPGSQVVETTEAEDVPVLTVAAKRPDGEVAVVLVNNGGQGQILLRGMPAGKPVSVWHSGRQVQMRPQARSDEVDKEGTLVVDVPVRSVTTVLTKKP